MFWLVDDGVLSFVKGDVGIYHTNDTWGLSVVISEHLKSILRNVSGLWNVSGRNTMWRLVEKSGWWIIVISCFLTTREEELRWGGKVGVHVSYGGGSGEDPEGSAIDDPKYEVRRKYKPRFLSPYCKMWTEFFPFGNPFIRAQPWSPLQLSWRDLKNDLKRLLTNHSATEPSTVLRWTPHWETTRFDLLAPKSD